MKYLLDRDWEQLVRREIRQVVMGDNEKTLNDATDTAIEFMSETLRQRYDVSKIFYDIPLWKSANQASYIEGEVVRDGQDNLYVCIENAPGTDLEDSNKYEKRDPRNKVVVQKLMDLVLYDLHSNISPNKIPRLRVDRYREAMEWLDRVRKETISPDLPLIDQENPVSSFKLSKSNKTAERW